MSTTLRDIHASVLLCSCGAAAVRTIGAFGHCIDCAEAFLAPLRARHGDSGIGRGRAPLAEAGSMVVLTCDRCGAGWRGPHGERCTWCAERLAKLRTWQAALVLVAPDIDRDDDRRPGALKAWAGRLAVAVEAGLIEATDARRVWERAQEAVDVAA